ncbi:MAG: hypothetical protein IPH18_04280 [Chitinophagaceae bacterium]|nr:hypothetical protein [Chitinophagaceae bacterium]
MSPAFGISFEKYISKKNSLETGILYRSCVDTGLKYYFFPTNWMNDRYTVTYSVKQSFLSIPLFYTRHTKILDISAGTTVDFFLNWKEKEKEIVTHSITSAPVIPVQVNPNSPPTFIYDSPQLEIMANGPLPFYKFDNSVLLGLLFRVSKKFDIYKDIYIEPFFSYNPVVTDYSINRKYISVSRKYLSAGVIAKYSL